VSCSLHDVVTLEARGVPAVAIGTEPFRGEAREQAEALGMPGYEMLELPHPIQPQPIDRVASLADAVVDAVARRLTGAAADG
jgi:hypothetical protein